MQLVREGYGLNGKNVLLVCAYDANLLPSNTPKRAEGLLVASSEVRV
jgi:hypothetical protein